MSIRELVNATMEDVSNYRYPNTSEFRTVINPILKAAGAGELLDSDRIEGMDIDEDALTISFSYSRMQCEMSGDRHLPLSVLDAEDPIAAATAWRLNQAVATAEKAHADAVRQMERATLSLGKAKAERGDIAATVQPDSGRDAALKLDERVIKDAIRAAYDDGYNHGKLDGSDTCSRYAGRRVEDERGRALIAVLAAHPASLDGAALRDDPRIHDGYRLVRLQQRAYETPRGAIYGGQRTEGVAPLYLIVDEVKGRQ